MSKNGLDGFVSIGSYGQNVIYPYFHSETKTARNDKALIKTAEKMVQEMSKEHGKSYNFGRASDLFDAKSGKSLDFVHKKGVKHAYGQG